MPRVTDEELAALASGLASQLRAIVPEWTGGSEHDPGVTLVEVFSFLADQLLYRATPMPERAERLLATTITALRTLQKPHGASFDGLTRVHYFEGQLLTADDLQTEQDYGRARHRRHNRALVGAGVVTGLNVTVDASSSPEEPVVSIGVGFAIAPDGEDLSVPSTLTCRLCAAARSGFVTLEYAERFVNPTPDAIALGFGQPSRVQEGIRVSFAEQAPPDAVALAKLERHHGEWRVAADFHVARAGHD